MARIAYLDCFSGASGDMLLGAWLDAGLVVEDLKADLALLGLANYELRVTRKVSHGISGTKFDVVDRGQDHPARNLDSVRQILDASALPGEVTAMSLRVFERLAQVEAGVHGTTVDAIHFHELGAVDSLIDIVGFCIALRRLEISDLYCSPLPVGSGVVRTEHGPLPVPAPATLALLAEVGAPVIPSQARGELLTPTGAALLTTLAHFSQPPMQVRRVGYGFGSKEFAWPNLVRIWIGDGWEAAGPQSWSGSRASFGPTHDHDHGPDPNNAHTHHT